MAQNPFIAFSWNRPFLTDLKTFIDNDSNGRTGQSVIITPNRRPWRYFANLYAKDKKVCILPKMFAFSDVVNLFNANTRHAEKTMALMLDQIALLYKCVKNAAKDNADMALRFAQMDIEQFLPWGRKLAFLLDEMFEQGITPKNISYVDDVSPTASAILGALGRIGEQWTAETEQRNWTTKGLSACFAVMGSEAIPQILKPCEDRKVYIAGFYYLSGTEDRILKSLWLNGATVCIHTDIADAENKRFHHHCHKHRQWLNRWHAAVKPVLYSENMAERKTEYIAAYDTHSQLSELKKIFDENLAEDQSTAIILPQSDLLMPVLHHLPDKDVNISIGYPIQRTGLPNFIEELFDLAEKQTSTGLYYWKNILRLVRHPYFKILARFKKYNSSLQVTMDSLEKKLLAGSKYINLDDLVFEASKNLNEEEKHFFNTIFYDLIKEFSQIKTLRQTANILKKIRSLFLSKGESFWNLYPVDSEVIVRFGSKIIPALSLNSLADNEFSLKTLHEITLQAFAEERIPFEADPITGLQILGVDETRLLHFDNIIFLDACEDILPGYPSSDPLLPHTLRNIIGLKSQNDKETETAHNIFRLCANARKTVFLWQEGISQSSLFSSKKSRSRFVEELIWEYEKKQKTLLKNDEYPLKTAKAFIKPGKKHFKNIDVKNEVLKKLEDFCSRPFSVSALDDYLRCPFSFACRHLFNIQPLHEVNEGEDAGFSGKIIHETLYRLFLPYKGMEIQNDCISFQQMINAFNAVLEENNAKSVLPADAYLTLEITGTRQLGSFLKKQPEKTVILELEKDINTKFIFCDQQFQFKGRIDRMDLREEKKIIIDYKISKKNNIIEDLWLNEDIYARLENAAEEKTFAKDRADSLFYDLQKNMSSLQLPCYIALLNQEKKDMAEDGRYIYLSEEKMEHSIFSKAPEIDSEKIKKFTFLITGFVASHLKNAAMLPAAENARCKWCPYSGICKY